MRESGMTFKKIGEHFGFGAQRAMQLYKGALRDEMIEKSQINMEKQLEEMRKHDARYVFTDLLPQRAINALWRYGINTLEELRATSPEYIRRMRNVGQMTYDMIMKVRGEE